MISWELPLWTSWARTHQHASNIGAILQSEICSLPQLKSSGGKLNLSLIWILQKPPLHRPRTLRKILEIIQGTLQRPGPEWEQNSLCSHTCSQAWSSPETTRSLRGHSRKSGKLSMKIALKIPRQAIHPLLAWFPCWFTLEHTENSPTDSSLRLNNESYPWFHSDKHLPAIRGFSSAWCTKTIWRGNGNFFWLLQTPTYHHSCKFWSLWTARRWELHRLEVLKATSHLTTSSSIEHHKHKFNTI